MQALLTCCCGIDVHDEMIETCILKGDGDEPEIIRAQFATIPSTLKEFAAHLTEHGCSTVAMESTGVFWRPIYEIIEDECECVHDIVVTNAAHMSNVPGRKNDEDDAEWIATLLRHGLLDASFVPDRIFRDLREASRLYKKFVGEKSRYTNRIMKLLQAHGFKLSNVLSDVLGASGRNILHILAERGSLSAHEVATCIRGNTKHSYKVNHAAVSGSLNPDEQKMLSILLNKIYTAERDMSTIINLMSDMSSEFRRQLDIADSLPGIDKLAAILILAEISAYPHLAFSSAAKLCKWAGLSPRNDMSAGKTKSKKILPGNPYVKSILCQAAWAAVKSRKNPFRDWFWSHRHKGDKKAIIAVARKILTTLYALLRDDVLYDNDYSYRQSTRPNSVTVES
jgi:transposase